MLWKKASMKRVDFGLAFFDGDRRALEVLAGHCEEAIAVIHFDLVFFATGGREFAFDQGVEAGTTWTDFGVAIEVAGDFHAPGSILPEMESRQ